MNILDITPEKSIFNQSGTPIDPELRPIWRISLILLILFRLCTGNKATAKKIQVLASLISSSQKRKNYLALEKDIFNTFHIRFDPLVDKAINIAIGEGLLVLDKAKSVKLSPEGKSFAEVIDNDSEIFSAEKKFIERFDRKFFTDLVIESVMSGGQQ